MLENVTKPDLGFIISLSKQYIFKNTQETKVGVLGCEWLYLVVIGCKNRCNIV